MGVLSAHVVQDRHRGGRAGWAYRGLGAGSAGPGGRRLRAGRGLSADRWGIVLHDNDQRALAALGLLDSFRPHLQPCPVIAAELCGGRIPGTIEFGRFSPPLRHLPAMVLRYSCRSSCLPLPAPVVWRSASGIGSSPPRPRATRPYCGLPTAPASAPTSCWPATAPAQRPGLAFGSPHGADTCDGRTCGAWPTLVGSSQGSASCGTPTAGSSGWRRCPERGPISTARRRVDAGRRPFRAALRSGSRRGPAATRRASPPWGCPGLGLRQL
jgi:hypothetical protein